MKTFLCAVLLIAATAGANAEERIYSGPWKTTNRKLDGVMTCIVTPLAKNKWHGRFFGTWQGVDFDYKVDFQGPSDDLRGTATIDGAAYAWRGRIDPRSFRANFAGQYNGSFELLRRTKPPIASARR
jgi:hypothetical protein